MSKAALTLWWCSFACCTTALSSFFAGDGDDDVPFMSDVEESRLVVEAESKELLGNDIVVDVWMVLWCVRRIGWLIW